MYVQRAVVDFLLSRLPERPLTRNVVRKAVEMKHEKQFCVGLAVDPLKHFYFHRERLDRLVASLRRTEISVVHAHRQAGKTTFVERELNDGRGWILDLANFSPEQWAKIESLTKRTPHYHRPSMIIVDEAQLSINLNEHQLVSKLRQKCQALAIPLIAVGTFPAVACLAREWPKGFSPIVTDNIRQLPPLSLAEVGKFFHQACNEFQFTFGRGVVDAIYQMSGGNVGFLGIVGNYLVQNHWSGHTFLLLNYFRAFNDQLHRNLLLSRTDVLCGILDNRSLVHKLRFVSRLTENDLGKDLGPLLTVGILVEVEDLEDPYEVEFELDDDDVQLKPKFEPFRPKSADANAKYILASPLYRFYLSSALSSFSGSAQTLQLHWPSIEAVISVLSRFDANTLSQLHAMGGSLNEYAYQSEFARSVARIDPNILLLSEVKWGGLMRADFLLGAGEHRHVVELLIGRNFSSLEDHGERAILYQHALGAQTASLVCFSHERPDRFCTFEQAPVVYVWPVDRHFSGFCGAMSGVV